MTRYILSGGFPWKAPHNGKTLCDTIYSSFSNEKSVVNLLICLFAQPPSIWQEKISDPLQMLRQHIPPHLHGMITIADPFTFLDQIGEADCIYLNGGQTPLLVKALHSYNMSPTQWRQLFAGKTVVGSSAGTNALTAFSINIDTATEQEGLGIIEKGTLVHYRSTTYRNQEAEIVQWDEIDTAFAQGCAIHGISAENQLLIPECEFISLS